MSESTLFHGGNPRLKPDACCRYNVYRAFFLSARVNRSSLRPQKEPQSSLISEEPPSCVTGHAHHSGPGRFHRPRASGESREYRREQVRGILFRPIHSRPIARTSWRQRHERAPVRIGVPKSPYDRILKNLPRSLSRVRLDSSMRFSVSGLILFCVSLQVQETPCPSLTISTDTEPQ